jgi:hypothetical protein
MNTSYKSKGNAVLKVINLWFKLKELPSKLFAHHNKRGQFRWPVGTSEDFFGDYL